MFLPQRGIAVRGWAQGGPKGPMCVWVWVGGGGSRLSANLPAPGARRPPPGARRPHTFLDEISRFLDEISRFLDEISRFLDKISRFLTKKRPKTTLRFSIFYFSVASLTQTVVWNLF